VFGRSSNHFQGSVTKCPIPSYLYKYWVWSATKCSWQLNWKHIFGVFITILRNFMSPINCVLTISANLACPQIHLQSHACSVWATANTLRGHVGLYRVISLYQATGRRTGESQATARAKNVKWSRYRPDVTQKVGRGIPLLFHDRGTRRGWVVGQQHAPATFISRKRPGTHCTGGWVGPRVDLDGRKISSPPGFLEIFIVFSIIYIAT